MIKSKSTVQNITRQDQPHPVQPIQFNTLPHGSQNRLTTACLLLIEWIEQQAAERAEAERKAA